MQRRSFIFGTLATLGAARIAKAQQSRKTPKMWEHRQFTDADGLLSYGPDFQENWRIVARYVDRILKGAKPAEMPVQQATKFELVINLKTARALGLNIPTALLVRADHVIE